MRDRNQGDNKQIVIHNNMISWSYLKCKMWPLFNSTIWNQIILAEAGVLMIYQDTGPTYSKYIYSWVELLSQDFHPRGIFEKNQVHVKKIENKRYHCQDINMVKLWEVYSFNIITFFCLKEQICPQAIFSLSLPLK